MYCNRTSAGEGGEKNTNPTKLQRKFVEESADSFSPVTCPLLGLDLGQGKLDTGIAHLFGNGGDRGGRHFECLTDILIAPSLLQEGGDSQTLRQGDTFSFTEKIGKYRFY